MCVLYARIKHTSGHFTSTPTSEVRSLVRAENLAESLLKLADRPSSFVSNKADAAKQHTVTILAGSPSLCTESNTTIRSKVKVDIVRARDITCTVLVNVNTILYI